MPSRSGGSRGGGSRTTKSYDFPVGRGDGKTVHATNTFEQQMAMAQIADELKRVMNSGKEPGDEGWASYDDGKEYNFIARNFDRIYDSDPAFKQWFDENFGGGGSAGQAAEESAAGGTPAAVQTSAAVNNPDGGGMRVQSASGGSAGRGGGRHWMDVPMGTPNPATPGYLTAGTVQRMANNKNKKKEDPNDFFRK